MKAWQLLAISIVQIFLLLAHWFVGQTWIAFDPGEGPAFHTDLRVALLALAFSFTVTFLFSLRFTQLPVALAYRFAAIWLGFLNYFFWAACLCWPIWYGLRLLGVPADQTTRSLVADGLFGAALLAGLYGLINARRIRIRRLAVTLPNLPATWRGRRAVLLSDLHLGPINGVRFCQRMAKLAASFAPDIIFLPGDVFDGTRGDLDQLLAPIGRLAPRFGIYFSSGNHEEMHFEAESLAALARAGIHILSNERVTVDGLHIAGIPYRDSTQPAKARAALEKLCMDSSEVTILLNHAPTCLPQVEEAGVSLQLSGHTHGGQFFPFTWITHRVFGPFTYGMNRFGALQVYTSSGCGTWGPPMRVGSRPEIVVLEFCSRCAAAPESLSC